MVYKDLTCQSTSICESRVSITDEQRKKIKLCKEILGSINNDKEELSRKESWEELLFRLTGKDPWICPCCGKDRK